MVPCNVPLNQNVPQQSELADERDGKKRIDRRFSRWPSERLHFRSRPLDEGGSQFLRSSMQAT